MLSTRLSIASLNINKKAKDRLVEEPSEPVYGGYANARGEIFLFGEDLVYRVNFKNQTLQQRPPLNAGAQARYDATAAGEAVRVLQRQLPPPRQHRDQEDLLVGRVPRHPEVRLKR